MNHDAAPFGEAGPVAYNPDMPVTSARNNAEQQIMAMPGVHGVGEGQDQTGSPAWIAYVTDRSAGATLPKSINGRRVIVEVTGNIDALPR